MKITSSGGNIIIQDGSTTSSYLRGSVTAAIVNGAIVIKNNGTTVKTISDVSQVTTPSGTTMQKLLNVILFVIQTGSATPDLLDGRLSDYDNKQSIAQSFADLWAAVNQKQPISATKRQERYSGTTNASGVFTGTFTPAFSAAPNIQAGIVNGTNTQTSKVTVSATGFTVTVVNRVDVIGLLPTYVAVNGAAVDVLVTEK